MYAGLMMDLAEITQGEVWATDLHAFVDIAMVADNDAVRRASVGSGDSSVRVDDGPNADIDVLGEDAWMPIQCESPSGLFAIDSVR